MKPKKTTAIREIEIKIGNWVFYPGYGGFVNQTGIEFFIDNRLNKLLHILVDKKGLIVKRDEIIDIDWEDVRVNEENLTKGIFDLRKSLKDKNIDEVEIETIRNIGYRLNVNAEVKRSKSMMNIVLKAMIYFLVISSLLVLFIRAIRYEN